MYIPGKGISIEGPGTSLVQRINWTTGQEAEMGMSGCAGGLSGCGCGGKCDSGLGLFDSMDPTTWTWQEYAAIGVGGYILTSLFFTGKRAAGQVGEGVRRARKRVGKRVGSRIAGSK